MENMENTVVGCRFHPTDYKLIKYLENKNQSEDEARVSNVINEVNIYNHDPWKLPSESKIHSDDDDDDEQNMENMENRANLIGYRFHPTDEELINYYLRNIHSGDEARVRDVINEVNICNHDPWELPSESKIQSDDNDDEQNVWYFFSLSSKRGKRTTKSGYWKPTGKDRVIRVGREVIGTKKTLVFYKGSNPRGVKTSWVIHEYHSSVTPSNKKAYVVCKLKNKTVENNPVPSSDGVEAIHPPPPGSDNPWSIDGISEVIVQEEDFAPESLLDFDYDDCLDLQSNEHKKTIFSWDQKHPIDSTYNYNALPSQEISPPDVLCLDPIDADEGQEDEFVNSFLADHDDEVGFAEENTTGPISEPIVRLYPGNITNKETEALNSSIETPTQASSYTSIRDDVSDYSEYSPAPTCFKDTNQMIFKEQSKFTKQMIFEESRIFNSYCSRIMLLIELFHQCSQISVSLETPLGAGVGARLALNAPNSRIFSFFENHFMQFPVQKFRNNHSSKSPYPLGKYVNVITKRSSSTSQHRYVAKDSRFPVDSRSQKHQVARQNKHRNLASVRDHATALQIKFKHMKRTPRCSNLYYPMQKMFKHPVLRKRVPALCY